MEGPTSGAVPALVLSRQRLALRIKTRDPAMATARITKASTQRGITPPPGEPPPAGRTSAPSTAVPCRGAENSPATATPWTAGEVDGAEVAGAAVGVAAALSIGVAVGVPGTAVGVGVPSAGVGVSSGAVGVGVSATGVGVGAGLGCPQSTSIPVNPPESPYTTSKRRTPSALIAIVCTEPLPAGEIAACLMTLSEAS